MTDDTNKPQPRASFGDDGFTVNSGYITLYAFDPYTSVYKGSWEGWVQIYSTEPAGSTRFAPPTANDGQVAVFDNVNKKWNVLESHIGQTVWRKADANAFQISKPGPLPADVVTVAPPALYGHWDDSTQQWVVDKAAVANALKQQALSVLSVARMQIYNNYGIFNEDTPDDCVAYIRALTAIAKGKDTTSTALPEAPADLNPS
ncbi:hypothetical protein GM556_01130 [Bombella sp. ESL0378]|uniref:hypothetical protein n=1 Tax=Bombella sp. ESL0378 TaxID=2676442 RepID=UPI0012D98A18|nr:hypothetical protein [Bombella sp. ESL0378]MUG04149.1 hypothetical protein [Bombella sp. ESL0378]